MNGSSQFDDERLVLLALSGNQKAFADLVKKYQGAVYGQVYCQVRQAPEAEEIAQEVFIEAYGSLPNLRDPARFGAWLRGIAFRVGSNWIKKRKRRERILEQFSEPLNWGESRESKSVTEIAEEAELHEQVRKAVHELPEKFRLPVILRYMQGLSYQEIAIFLGTTTGSVRGLLYRGNQMLRRRLRMVVEDEDNQWRRVTQ